jgi:MFS transporter, DHA1 family, multidrug resistance protein
MKRPSLSRLKLEPWQRTLYIMFFAQLVAAMGFSIIFPFLPLYVEHLGTNTGLSLEFWAGMVFSVQAVTMAIASPIWGGLADRFGRKLMVERAMFGGSVIILLMAFARTAEELVLLRALQGALTGTISASNALVASQAPRERAGYAMGLLQVGLWAGVAVGPLMGGLLADMWGFRLPFIVTAALLFAAGLLVWRSVRESFTPVESDPEEQRGFIAEWRRVFSSPGIGVTYLVRFLSGVGQYMVYPIAPLFVRALLPEGAPVGSTTGLVIGVSAAASTAAAIYLGRLGDQIGHRRVLRASALLAALFCLPQSMVTAAWQLLVLQALTGIAMGGIIPTVSALLARYTRQGGEGAVYGMDNSVTAASRALAPMLSATVAVGFGLRGAFVAIGLAFLVTTAVAAWALPDTRPGATVSSASS